MCGIAGIFNSNSRQLVQPLMLNAMLGVIRHRGPEAAGMVLDGPLGLGHDRLSIIDLDGGLQPIGNEDGSVWIVCNGEVFNYVELRAELISRGHTFRTHSDTEVIIHLYEERGPECVHQLNGQFAFALWDARKQTLMLARDRLGVRPLYYTSVDGDLLFASEIKALLASRRVEAALDLGALDQVFTYWSTLPGRTVFQGVEEVPPAHYLLAGYRGVSIHRYWTLDFSEEDQGWGRSESYYAEKLLDLLVDAARLRLRADVPVGAYLSGGLDSSAIAAVVRHYTGNRLKTFSIAFSDGHFDERVHQQRMADYLGTEHVSMECTDADIAAVFPDVVWHAETPLLRTAPGPMFLLSNLVRQHGLKVVLTGEGADEFLGGYDIFKETKVRRFWAREPNSKLRPLLLRKLYGDVRGIGDTSQAYLEAFFKNGLTETGDPHYSHLVRWRGTARIKRFFSADARSQLAGSCGPPKPNSGNSQLATHTGLVDALAGLDSSWDPVSKAQFVESRIFMSQYLLSSQGDRVAMAHAIEGRFPFLDYRLVEFAATIPPDLRLKGLNEKYILKRAVAHLLPPEVLARTKRPYRAPIRNAFLGDAAPEYVKEALSPEQINKVGIFDEAAVSMLVRKCTSASVIGEADSMALVGVLSTQLLHKLFVQERDVSKTTPAGFSAMIVGQSAEPEYALRDA